MKQRITAGLLALLICFSVVGLAQALPDEEPPAAPETETADSASPETPEQPEESSDAKEPSEETEEPSEEKDPPSPAGPDAEPTEDVELPAYEPDPVGTLRFENVERRMREKNLNLLSLQENIAAVESMDYDKMYDDLRTSLNQIAKGQWGLIQMGQGSSYTYQKLEDAYNAVRKQFDAIKDGELQADNAAVVRQLKNLQDQIIMAGEALYISLTDLEQQETSLQRQLTAMNRTVEEMTLRYDLGQISALQLEQAKSGRSSLSSGLKTLQMNIKTLKTQLELLIGADLTGKLTLGAVPKVTDAELKKIDLKADLTKAKEKSYELFDANETLKDAKEDYLDALSENGIDSTGYAMQAAKHTWQAAQHTYQSTVQDYELRFRTLHAQVLDDQQILQAAKVSLATQKSSYESSKLKAKQGSLSKNKLADAKDELSTAEEAVRSAEINLFSAYNTYCWAVQHGILN